MNLQVMVASHDGVDIMALMRAIETAYVLPDGSRVRVERGLGPAVNGLPLGVLALVKTARVAS